LAALPDLAVLTNPAWLLSLAWLLLTPAWLLLTTHWVESLFNSISCASAGTGRGPGGGRGAGGEGHSGSRCYWLCAIGGLAYLAAIAYVRWRG
jgi:hypothetical protein